MEIKRTNGNTWFDELTTAIVPYYNADGSMMPEYEWYHDGAVFLIKNKIIKGDENKRFNPSDDIIWAEFLQILYNKYDVESKANS